MLFRSGFAGRGLRERAHLEQREIRDVHWTGPDDWRGRVAPYNERLLRVLDARHGHETGTVYLEDGTPVS